MAVNAGSNGKRACGPVEGIVCRPLEWTGVLMGRRGTITASLTLVVLSLQQIGPFLGLHLQLCLFSEAFVLISVPVLFFTVVQLCVCHLLKNIFWGKCLGYCACESVVYL